MIDLFLRDCSALAKGNYRWDINDSDYIFQGINRSINIAKKYKVNLQLTVHSKVFLYNEEKFYNIVDKINLFKKLTIHLHTDKKSLITNNKQSIDFIKKLKKYTNNFSNFSGFCIHPDNVQDYKILEELKGINNKSYIAIEVTDKNSEFGNRLEQIEKILNANKFIDLVLDTAHIEENTIYNQPNFLDYFRLFRNRIKEIHISSEGNQYNMKYLDNNFSTSHSLLCLNEKKILNNINKIKPYKTLNLIIEGVIPYGDYGDSLISREVKLMNEIKNNILSN